MPQEKKIKKAAALRYLPEKNNAPQIVALGKGEIAEKILKKAQESNIPIQKDDKLSDALEALNIGDQIPPELYEVVAQIFAYIGDIDKKYGDGNG
ncbi:MAG: flagellar biogenesis protein [Clostridium sp.]|nr:flagellar biogenesis protein [Clostridium sp.]